MSYLVGGFKDEWIIFHFIYGMSSETHWLMFFKMVKTTSAMDIPSGKHTKKLWKITLFCSWVNPLFRRGHGFDSELLVYQRVFF